MAFTHLILSANHLFDRRSAVIRGNPESIVSFDETDIPSPGFSASPDIVLQHRVGNERLLVVVTDQKVEVVITSAGANDPDVLAAVPVEVPAGGIGQYTAIIGGFATGVYVRLVS